MEGWGLGIDFPCLISRGKQNSIPEKGASQSMRASPAGNCGLFVTFLISLKISNWKLVAV